jgi:hypothetical protein
MQLERDARDWSGKNVPQSEPGRALECALLVIGSQVELDAGEGNGQLREFLSPSCDWPPNQRARHYDDAMDCAPHRSSVFQSWIDRAAH